MTVTLADLRKQCRGFLVSDMVWPDATLDLFVNDAIRAYSNEFPRRLRHTLALSTGVQAYDLPGGHGFVRLLSVECPAGQDPPAMLERADEWAAAFAGGGDVYALRPLADDVATASDMAMGQIVFAPAVSTGESAILTYAAVHKTVSADDEKITVPAAHLEAIIAFVDFRAHWERESHESYSAASSSLILSQLGENGRRAWNRWREVMRRLAPVGGWGSRPIEWGDIGL